MARNNKGRNDDKNIEKGRQQMAGNTNTKGNRSVDDLENDAESERTRKPGSQSNSSNRANSGRGGGK